MTSIVLSYLSLNQRSHCEITTFNSNTLIVILSEVKSACHFNVANLGWVKRGKIIYRIYFTLIQKLCIKRHHLSIKFCKNVLLPSEFPNSQKQHHILEIPYFTSVFPTHKFFVAILANFYAIPQKMFEGSQNQATPNSQSYPRR